MEKIDERLKNIEGWMADNAPYVIADQKHLDANSPEQAYWHYGYMVALRDILKLLTPS